MKNQNLTTTTSNQNNSGRQNGSAAAAPAGGSSRLKKRLRFFLFALTKNLFIESCFTHLHRQWTGIT